MKKLPGKYATVGFVVTKFALPVVKRRAKAKAKAAPAAAARAGVRTAKRNPGKTSLAIGSAVGAVGYLFARGRRSDAVRQPGNDDV